MQKRSSNPFTCLTPAHAGQAVQAPDQRSKPERTGWCWWFRKNQPGRFFALFDSLGYQISSCISYDEMKPVPIRLDRRASKDALMKTTRPQSVPFWLGPCVKANLWTFSYLNARLLALRVCFYSITPWLPCGDVPRQSSSLWQWHPEHKCPAQVRPWR